MNLYNIQCLTVTEGINIKFNLLGYVIPTERFKSIILTFLYKPTLGSITFRTSKQTVPKTPLMVETHATTSSWPTETTQKLQAPPIALINMAMFKWACRMEGSVTFQVNINPADVKGHVANLNPESVDMESVLEAYRDFSDVFSKAKADTLAPHRPYHLKIILEDGATPPQPPIYSLLNSKLGTLRDFIDEHLNIGFIWPSRSSHGAPILFVKKKDGSLQLCVDFWSLDKVTKKDRYPLPLITDLLDTPRKARIYTKIDLQHLYHLVRITEGNEWKTAFRTCYSSFE